MNKIDELWDYLISQNKRIVSSEDIEEACSKFDFKKYSMLQSMVNKEYLIPTFVRGKYFIKDKDEYFSQNLKLNPEQMIAALLNNEFGDKWYFGLSSANYVSGKSWQSLRILTIITNEVKSKKVEFMGLTVSFRNLNYVNFQNGIEVKEINGIKFRFSSELRTTFDYCYYYLKTKVEAYLLYSKDSISNFSRKDIMKYNTYPYFKYILNNLGV